MSQELDFVLGGEVELDTLYADEWYSFPGKDYINKEDFISRRRIIDDCMDFGRESLERDDLQQISKDLEAWLKINEIQEDEYLCVSNENLKRFIDPYLVTELISRKNVVHYHDYVVLGGLISSFLPENKKLIFAANGTFITKNDRDLTR